MYWYFSARGAVSNKTASKTGLVGYWSLDEGSGTLAGDASGNANTGTLTNGPTWADGKLGKALNFDGTNDYVAINNSLLPSINGSLSFWAKSSNNTDSYRDMVSISSGASGGTIFAIQFVNNSDSGCTLDHSAKLVLRDDGGTLTQLCSGIAMNDGKWHHYVGTAVSGSQQFYVDGVLKDTDTVVPGAATFTRFGIGATNRSTPVQFFPGQIDDVRIYSRALSATEITNLYNLGAAKLNASQNALLTNGLVGLWSFDGADLSGTTAYDRSGAGNNGTLTNGPVAAIGQLGQALNFDGVNDYINIGATDISSPCTMSTWVKLSSRHSIAAGLIGPVGSNTGFRAEQYAADAVGLTVAGVVDAVFSAPGYTVPLNTWTHLLTTINSATSATLYVNGTLSGTLTVSSGLACWRGDIGRNASGLLNGSIDDVRVYNRALSASEVQDLYALGDADKINSSMAQPQGTGRLDSGLQSYWPLDENTGTTTTDASTNALTGTMTNGPAWTTGQIEYGIDFDGTDDYVTTPDSPALDVVDSRNFTLTGWFNRDTFTTDDTIIAKRNGITAAENGYIAYIDDATDKLTLEVSDGTDEYQLESASTFVATGWHHFSLTWNDNVSTETKLYIDGRAESTTNTGTFANVNSLANALTFALGAESDAGNPFDGKLDEIRLYNRTMTADEVAQLYRLTTPTSADTALKGYWSFDGADLSGTTASDRSGAGNDGTLTGGPVAAIGKIGQALSFDDVNDYISVPANSSLQIAGDVTVAVNIKISSGASGSGSIITQSAGNELETGNFLYGLHIPAAGNGTTDIEWYHEYGAGSNIIVSFNTNLSFNTWYNIVAVRNDTTKTVALYVNGALFQSQSYTNSATGGNNTSMSIGQSLSAGGHWFGGSIDDVRVYNRALTATEVTALYNLGR